MEFTIIVDQHERISQTDDDGDAMGFSQEERQEEIDAPNKRISTARLITREQSSILKI
jgi:hypothetical protein